jgi:hypothetical protein
MADRDLIRCEDCGRTPQEHLHPQVRAECASGWGRFRRPPALRKADR